MPRVPSEYLHQRVATIADLTAIVSSQLINGQRIIVEAYDAGGFGGGVFKWVSTSTAATDGGVTFVPNDRQIVASPVTLVYGNFGNTNSYYQLAHTNIIWGSVAFSIQDGAQTIGSKWLHGHSIAPRHGAGGSLVGRTASIFDHGPGRIWGDRIFRMRRLLETNTVGGTVVAANRTMVLNYSYTTSAGRWIREVGDYVTPAMFGGRPGNSAFDNSFACCWTQNWLNSQDRVKKLKFDGNYYIKGTWAEIYSHLVFEGQGMENPAITFFGDQGGGTGGSADFLKDVYIDPLQNTITNTTDPYYCLGTYYGGGIQFSDATGWEFRDLYIDGNVANNLYFLTDESGAWDVGGVESRVSQWLRESPSMTGLSVSVQTDRTIAAGTRWSMHRCTIANMLGGCVVYANGGFMHYNNLRLGNSLSGRVLYGGQGFGTGLQIFGYTRSSFWAPYSGNFSNVVWSDVVENPWSENALEPEYFVLRGLGYHDEWKDVPYSTIVAERYGNEHCTLSQFSMDMSVLPSSGILKHVGGRYEASHGMIWGPYTGETSVVQQNTGNQEAGATVAATHIQVVNQAKEGFNVAQSSSKGYWNSLYMSDIYIEDTYSAVVTMTIASPAVVSLTAHGMAAGREIRFYSSGALPTGVTEGQIYYVIATDLAADTFKFSATLAGAAVNTSGSQSGEHRMVGADVNNVRLTQPVTVATSASSSWLSFNMDPYPALSPTSTALPPVPRQDIRFSDIVVDTHIEFLVLGEGSGSATAVPTDVHFDRCSWVSWHNKLVKSVETDVTFGKNATDGTYNLKIYMNECVFDLWDPGESGRGAADTTDPWLAIVVMRNCRTRTGKVSDYDAVITRTATDGATVTISNASPGVISWTSHGLAIGDRITLATTGALPTGLTAGESYYITATGFGANSFSVAKIAGGADINTSSAGSGTHSAAKADTQVLVANVTSLGYIEVPIPLLWKPITYDARPLSANAVTRGVTSVTVAYPNTTGATPDNTRPRIRIGCASVTAGDTLTYRITAAVAPPRVLK